MTSTETPGPVVGWETGDRVIVDPQWLHEMQIAGLLTMGLVDQVANTVGTVTGYTNTGAPQVDFGGTQRRVPNHALMEAPTDEGGEGGSNAVDANTVDAITLLVGQYAARVRGALRAAQFAQGYPVSLAEVRRQGIQGLRDLVALDTLVELVNSIDAGDTDGALSVRLAEILSTNNLR